MVAEIVHGAPYRFADPARFSLAHGGKDRSQRRKSTPDEVLLAQKTRVVPAYVIDLQRQ
jgi:hypothetical protein